MDALQRKIIHIDMDAFYASVEQRNNPDLRGKPVAVGGNEERGVISAASYEARKFGVKSAMNGKLAAKLCPNLIFVKHNFDEYKKASYQIRDVFARYTEYIEPLSYDEAFLDVTKSPIGSATFIAKSIKNDIKAELNLIASAGVSYNKFLAKVASDQEKPDGLFVITPDEGFDFVKQLPVKDFFGVGKVTAEKMKEMGILKGKDLLKFSLDELKTYFGKSGSFFYSIARGVDNRPVKPNSKRKSLGAERTFSKDILDVKELKNEFLKVVEILWERYLKMNQQGKTISIKLKFSDFTQITRAKTFPESIQSKENLKMKVLDLFKENFNREKPVRLVGASISGFKEEGKNAKEKVDKKENLGVNQLKFF